MVVEGPEVLHCVECDDGALVVVPVSGPVVAEKPQRPGILKVYKKVRLKQILTSKVCKSGPFSPIP